MSRKSRKNRTRSQGRKSAVVIPAIPELALHADIIRTIGRATFADAVEIGRRLVRCRKLLKEQGKWLAWLKAEFKWSRRHAESFIDLYLNRRRVAKFATLGLPVSAIHLLSKASARQRKHVTRYVEAGARLTVADVKRLTRTDPEPGTITTWPTAPGQGGVR